jgi:hypothetical protein
MRFPIMMATALSCAMVSVVAHAGEPSSADPLPALQGRWQGEGEVSGMRATIALEFRSAFGGRGYHLDFENRMTAKDGKAWTFAAEALYRCDGKGSCDGHWYDSRGMVLPQRVTADADRLVVEWGDAGTERGRTTYRLDEGALRITDEVLSQDGSWRVFGTNRATRSND